MIVKYDYESWIKAQRNSSGDCVKEYNESFIQIDRAFVFY